MKIQLTWQLVVLISVIVAALTLIELFGQSGATLVSVLGVVGTLVSGIIGWLMQSPLSPQQPQPQAQPPRSL
jgi:uncharacterized membrane protein